MQLQDILSDPAKKASFIRDGVALIESEVARKGGLGGMAIKAGFRAMKKVKPGILPDALGMLLPSFAPAIEPFFARAQADGDVAAWFGAHGGEVADAMLGVTDARAARATNRVLIKVYRGLRGQARVHTVEAMDGVGKLLANYTD